jgi:hypothetical protein
VFGVIFISSPIRASAQEVFYPAPYYGEPVGSPYTYSPFGGMVKVGPKEYIPANEPGVFTKTTKHIGTRTVIDYNYYLPQVSENGYYARKYLFERR